MDNAAKAKVRFVSKIILFCVLSQKTSKCLPPNLNLFLAKVIEKGTDDLRGNGFSDIYANQCFKDQFNDDFTTKTDENNDWMARWTALYPLYSVEEKLK